MCRVAPDVVVRLSYLLSSIVYEAESVEGDWLFFDDRASKTALQHLRPQDKRACDPPK